MNQKNEKYYFRRFLIAIAVLFSTRFQGSIEFLQKKRFLKIYLPRGGSFITPLSPLTPLCASMSEVLILRVLLWHWSLVTCLPKMPDLLFPVHKVIQRTFY
jgi:hypothetical protein